jgi:hypothetical protein
MGRKKLDIPNDWPRPWTELGEGEFVLLGVKLLAWKKYNRRAKFSIYGFSRSHYMRVWYGQKVLHFKMFFKRVNKKGKAND